MRVFGGDGEIGSQIVYRDEDHLTATFSRSLAEVLNQRLNASLHP